MGNLCGKEARDDNFSSPGRTLASAPPPPSNNTRASVPANVQQTRPSQKSPLLGNGRTLGSGEGQADNPREAAARAAEERIKADNAKKGRMAKSNRKVLEAASYENRRAREVDEQAEARAYN